MQLGEREIGGEYIVAVARWKVVYARNKRAKCAIILLGIQTSGRYPLDEKGTQDSGKSV